jgi:hypothetical protein
LEYESRSRNEPQSDDDRTALPVPPLRIQFENLPSKVAGYYRAATRRLFEELADSYETLWLECATLREREPS